MVIDGHQINGRDNRQHGDEVVGVNQRTNLINNYFGNL